MSLKFRYFQFQVGCSCFFHKRGILRFSSSRWCASFPPLLSLPSPSILSVWQNALHSIQFALSTIKGQIDFTEKERKIKTNKPCLFIPHTRMVLSLRIKVCQQPKKISLISSSFITVTCSILLSKSPVLFISIFLESLNVLNTVSQLLRLKTQTLACPRSTTVFQT